MIRLQIAGADVDVANIAAARHDAAAAAIADVAADDVRLVQRQVIVKNPDAAVVIDMAVADEDIAVTVDQMNAMPALADSRASNGQLHRAIGLDGVGLFVRPNELHAVD